MLVGGGLDSNGTLLAVFVLGEGETIGAGAEFLLVLALDCANLDRRTGLEEDEEVLESPGMLGRSRDTTSLSDINIHLILAL